MNNSYKKSMDKIQMSDTLKNSIIDNTTKAVENKKKKRFEYNNIKGIIGMAACFVFCVVSYNITKDYFVTPPTIEMEMQPTTNNTTSTTDNTQNIESTTTDSQNNSQSINNQSGDMIDSKNKININNATISKSDNTKSNTNMNTNSNKTTNIPKEKVSEPMSEIISNNDNLETENPQSEMAIMNEKIYDEPQLYSDNELCEGSPMADIKSIEDISKIVGYDIKTPDIADNYTIDSMYVIDNTIAQIVYTNDTDNIMYRTSIGNEDISGDYNIYSDIVNIKINNIDVTIKGNDSLYHNAIWFDNSKVYCIYSENGINLDSLVDIVKSVK